MPPIRPLAFIRPRMSPPPPLPREQMLQHRLLLRLQFQSPRPPLCKRPLQRPLLRPRLLQSSLLHPRKCRRSPKDRESQLSEPPEALKSNNQFSQENSLSAPSVELKSEVHSFWRWARRSLLIRSFARAPDVDARFRTSASLKKAVNSSAKFATKRTSLPNVPN